MRRLVLFTSLFALLLAPCPRGATAPTGAWERGPDLPLGVGGAAAAWLRGRLVVAAGSYWEGGQKRWTDRVQAYDPAAHRWEPLPPLPLAASNGGHASDGESLFVLGGLTAEGATDRCWRLRSGGGEWQWEPLPPLPQASLYGAGAWVEGSLYHAGGAADPADLRSATNAAYRLDLRRPGARWERIAPIPGRPRGIAAVAAERRSFTLFGGAHSIEAGKVENLPDTLQYVPRENRWRVRRPMPRAMRAATAAALPGGEAVLLGGYSGTPAEEVGAAPGYGFERRVLLYDPASDGFREVPPLPAPVADARGAFGDGQIYVAGGEDRARSRTPALLSAALAALRRPPEGPEVWVCLGDSVTRGVREGVTDAQTYPAVLQTLLGNGARVVNAGQGGETTRGALDRFASVMNAQPNVDTLVIMYGLNDAAMFDPGPVERREPRVALADYRRNLRLLIAEGRRRGARVVLCTSNPMTPAYRYAGQGSYARAGDVNFMLRDYVQVARDVAREERVPLVDVYARFTATPGWEALLPDGLHPKPKGLAIIAEAVRQAWSIASGRLPPAAFPGGLPGADPRSHPLGPHAVQRRLRGGLRRRAADGAAGPGAGGRDHRTHRGRQPVQRAGV